MVKVKRSAIHGKGLFSTRDLAKGTLLGYCKTRPAEDVESPYVIWMEEGPLEVLCDLKYINHSPRPNVAYYDDLSVMTLRAVKAGEELTHNYEQ